MRKPDFCICENKDADQLCGNRTADQRLCFRYIDSAIPSSHIQSAQSGLCGTWSETPKTGFSHNEAHIFQYLSRLSC